MQLSRTSWKNTFSVIVLMQPTTVRLDKFDGNP